MIIILFSSIFYEKLSILPHSVYVSSNLRKKYYNRKSLRVDNPSTLSDPKIRWCRTKQVIIFYALQFMFRLHTCRFQW